MIPAQLLADRINRLIHTLEKGLYERHEAIRLSLLAALCGESVFMLGPPGIAKSLIARRLKQAFYQAKAFEYLMTRFSTPEEVFGPLSLQALKDEGRYLRMTEGYLPDAEIVFLDEIWKAGPAILNTLLTAINEKQFRNGKEEIRIPMRILLTASNELPEENTGLDALYDRLLVRIRLDNVHEKKSFHGLLIESSHLEISVLEEHLQIHEEEYQQWQKEIIKINLPDTVFELIFSLRQQLATLAHAPYISDRRWKKATHLLQASAYFSGRREISPLDLALLKECLWHNDESFQLIDNEIRQLLTLQGWQQQTLLFKLQQIKNKKLKLEQDRVKSNALKLLTQRNFFQRKIHHALPEYINGSQITLTLQNPMILCNIRATHIEIVLADLKYWLEKRGEIRAKINGIGFNQSIELFIDDEDYLLISDSSLHTTYLMTEQCNHFSGQNLSNPEIEAELDELDSQLQQQRLLFRQHQPCLFIQQEWLAIVEASLDDVAEKIAKAYK